MSGDVVSFNLTMLDLLDEIERDSIHFQNGGGANTGALVIKNLVNRRLAEGPRKHSVLERLDGFWRCSCSPGAWRPYDHDPYKHQLLATMSEESL